ncbi:MAG: 3'-to-5' oligoribonuclease A [Brockia lithotrophica]|uniref:3'-to-5' oligoribonuclease A n=1 Tax=Brockia lithotrophica TaxID=933949 RepID=A0A2T5G8V8_9BACL|nr:MAG: 3'-to-5' oligoribonuclease A [Brockia lithotrophica]
MQPWKERDLEEFRAFLAVPEPVLVATHVDPDGDALGSQGAVTLWLRRRGIPAEAFLEAHPPRRFAYLPHVSDLKVYARSEAVPPAFSGGAVPRFSRAIFVDAASFDRVGRVAELLADGAAVVNIDHHVTNTRYGHLNFVNPESSSSAEVVYDLIRSLGEEIDEDVAVSLYTGYLTDTGGFRFRNTSAKVFRDVSELIARGVSPADVAEFALDTLTLPHLRLLRLALGTLRMHADGLVATLTVTQAILREADAAYEDAEGLVGYARAIEGVEVGILFRETAEGAIRVSLRSRRNVDVSRIAARFGGGGHARAAGATLAPPLAQAEANVLAAVEEALRELRRDPTAGGVYGS